MRGGRRFPLAAGAIVLLFAAALGLTWWVTEGGPAPAPPPPAAAAEPAPLPLPPPSLPPPPVDPPTQVARPSYPAVPHVAPAPDATPWEDVPAAAEASALGPLAGAVHAGLEANRDRMDYCFQEEIRRLEGRSPPRPGPGEPPAGPASLVLRLETRAGAVEIVDTEMEYRATSTPELVECCRRALRAVELPAPAARPGQRFRLKLLLQ